MRKLCPPAVPPQALGGKLSQTIFLGGSPLKLVGEEAGLGPQRQGHKSPERSLLPRAPGGLSVRTVLGAAGHPLCAPNQKMTESFVKTILILYKTKVVYAREL